MAYFEYCDREWIKYRDHSQARMITIDHIGVMAQDAAASARYLAEILGLAPASPAGPDGDIFRLDIGESGRLLYFPAEAVLGQHIAFRVDEAAFALVVDRLSAKGVAFGNEPEDQANMQTADSLGGHGRVFFRDPNGHLFEVIA
jgi:catechol 2,3-dioxygenase-like lactoylglutathione lyase family enzyme